MTDYDKADWFTCEICNGNRINPECDLRMIDLADMNL